MPHQLRGRKVLVALALLAASALACSARDDKRATPPATEAMPTPGALTPVALAEEFRAAQGCVSLRYPTGWIIYLTGALSAEYPSLCPGFPQTGKTIIVTDCDTTFDDVVSDLIDLGSGELRPNGSGHVIIVSLEERQKGCTDPKGDALRMARYIRNTSGKVIDDEGEAVVSGQPASCAEYETDAIAGRTLQCFFDFDGVRYSFSASAPVAEWPAFSPTAQAMRDSIQCKRFPACGSPGFPVELTNFCP